MKLSIRAMLLGMSSISLLAIVVLGGLSVNTAQSGEASLIATREEVIEPLSVVYRIDALIKDVRFRIAGVALGQLPAVGSSNHLGQTRKELPKLWDAFLAVSGEATLPEDTRQSLEQLKKGMAGLPAFFDQLDAAYQTGDRVVIEKILEEDWPLVHASVIKPLDAMLPYYQGRVDAFVDAARDRASVTLIQILLILALTVCITAVVNYMVGRRILACIAKARELVGAIASLDFTHRVDVRGEDELAQLVRQLIQMQDQIRPVISQVLANAHTLDRFARELATISARVAQTSSDQSESAAGMAAAMEELTVSIDQVEQHARQAGEVTRDSSTQSHESGRIIHEAAAEMSRIADAVNSTAVTIRELEDFSGQISSIVNAIRDIADQTNLLALNAAIEAARAGEQGRGFAVVADEVRKLAERTSGATQEITGMIDKIQQGTQRAVQEMEAGVARVNDGVGLARQAGDSVKDIRAASDRIIQTVKEIHAALKEQSVSARDVAQRVERIAQGVEVNTSAINEVASSAGGLERLASEMKSIANRFRVA